MSAILSTKNLTKQFDGVKAVNDLSIDIKQGAVTGIVGPNGSGKTTLVNVLTGIFPYNEGVVYIQHTELSKINPYDVPTYGMTRTFQQVRLFEQMSVIDNILVVLTERGVSKSLFEKHSAFHQNQAEEILKKVDLWEKRNENAENLSYGQRRLLEIARALAMKSNLIFFDEPFAGLFPKMRNIVSSVIKSLREEEKTIVLIEHDMNIIRDLCDHLIVLDAGTLLAEGVPEKVLSQKNVKEAYLGE